MAAITGRGAGFGVVARRAVVEQGIDACGAVTAAGAEIRVTLPWVAAAVCAAGAALAMSIEAVEIVAALLAVVRQAQPFAVARVPLGAFALLAVADVSWRGTRACVTAGGSGADSVLVAAALGGIHTLVTSVALRAVVFGVEVAFRARAVRFAVGVTDSRGSALCPVA